MNVTASNMSKVYRNSTTDTSVAAMLRCGEYNIMIILHTNSVVEFNTDQGYSLLAFLQAAAILIIIISITRLALECYQFIQLVQDYFLDLSNWVEIPLFICSIIFALVFDHECLCPRRWQWQIGILALFLAWLDLIFFMRKVRLMGMLKHFTKLYTAGYYCASMVNEFRYWYLCVDVREHLQDVLEDDHTDSPTGCDICSCLLHGLPSV